MKPLAGQLNEIVPTALPPYYTILLPVAYPSQTGDPSQRHLLHVTRSLNAASPEQLEHSQSFMV
jgi:hypothetical protein